jgi:hypothetical protein
MSVRPNRYCCGYRPIELCIQTFSAASTSEVQLLWMEEGVNGIHLAYNLS